MLQTKDNKTTSFERDIRMNEDRVRDFAQRIGMDPLDTSIQEGAFLAKHIEKCEKCAKLLSVCNEVISHHAREDFT